MGKIKSVIWPLEPHTEAKHVILKRYLGAWLPIISRWNGRIIFIDAFAGPGEYKNGEDGSPIIAINAVLNHQIKIKSEILMLFIEKDKDRFEFLKKKLAELKLPSNLKVKPIPGKFDETLTELFDYLEEQKKTIAPTFVFIDPFGFSGIPMNLIKRIMQNPKCEVLITFMYEEINRFIKLENLWPNLVDTFGTDKWKQVISEADPAVRVIKLHQIYKKQLESAGIKYVQSFKMVNKSNRPDYFLFFGTNAIIGLKKMKEAMWKVDSTGAFRFSDVSHDPNQATLFAAEPDYYQLKNMLVKEFKGKLVSVDEIENFVLTKTGFRETHFKRQILAPMEKVSPPEIEVKSKEKRRVGTFPSNCFVKFI